MAKKGIHNPNYSRYFFKIHYIITEFIISSLDFIFLSIVYTSEKLSNYSTSRKAMLEGERRILCRVTIQLSSLLYL